MKIQDLYNEYMSSEFGGTIPLDMNKFARYAARAFVTLGIGRLMVTKSVTVETNLNVKKDFRWFSTIYDTRLILSVTDKHGNVLKEKTKASEKLKYDQYSMTADSFIYLHKDMKEVTVVYRDELPVTSIVIPDDAELQLAIMTEIASLALSRDAILKRKDTATSAKALHNEALILYTNASRSENTQQWLELFNK